MTGNREDGPCLSEVMGARETSTQCCATEPPELALRVPPLREIHFAKPCNDKSKLQQAVRIEHR